MEQDLLDTVDPHGATARIRTPTAGADGRTMHRG
jgi:hypothetical protein